MMTPWGESVAADNTWREYPRPQLRRDAWQNLNGLWHYAIAPRRAAQPAHWDSDILIPFCTESALSHLKPNGIWYTP